jgi:DNA invertase Pin-like site-specific DNA recombinase
MAEHSEVPDMRIIAYLRVSTNEQADSGAGLAAQRAAILAEAERRGWTEVEFIEDAGYSAKSLRRPALTYALDRLKRGDADVLAVSKMDRLSRSLLDFASVMQTAQKEGWALVALDSPADLSTPSGEAMAGVMAVFAQLERRLISERTKAALAERRRQGVRLGRPRVIAEEVERIVCDLKAGGATFKTIAATLVDAGHLPPSGGDWQASTLHRIVRRRVGSPA